MKKLLPALLVLLLAFNGCKKEQPTDPDPITSPTPTTGTTTGQQPAAQATVTAVSPSTGTAGTVVTISGTNFGTSPTDVKVLFNGVAGNIQSVTTTEIKVITPVATSGNVVVSIGSQNLTGLVFTYTLPATVTGLLPTSGTPGTLVTITGTNFVPSATGVKVLFNGVAAVVQSTSATEIKATVPVTNSGNVTVTVNNQTITGPAFTFISPLVPYISGDVRLNTQADVDAFVALNKGKQLQIIGSLNIGNPSSDITSVAGLSNITSVSSTLSLYYCPLVTDFSFLNHITSAGTISFSYLSVTTITMDNLSTVKGSLNISSCKNLNDISFKSLANTDGLNIYSCSQLSNMDFSTLSSVSGRLTVWFTNLTDLNAFSSLQTAGSLSLYFNSALSSLNGLARLTTLSLPAITAGTSSSVATRVNGIYIAYNPKLASLAGLQSVTDVPIIYISDNSMLNDFCPLKTPINTLSNWPGYTYTASSGNSGSNPFVTASRPALTLINNGSYATTKDGLTVVALCQ